MGFEPTKHMQQILSLSPLTTREYWLFVSKRRFFIFLYDKLTKDSLSITHNPYPIILAATLHDLLLMVCSCIQRCLGWKRFLSSTNFLSIFLAENPRSAACALGSVVLANLPEPRMTVFELDFFICVDLGDECLRHRTRYHSLFDEVNEHHMEEFAGSLVLALNHVDVIDA